MSTALASPAARAGTALRALHAGLGYALEATVLLLVAGSPWAFAAVHPFFEGMLFYGVAVVAALWAARTLVAREFRWQACPAVLCLLALFLFGAFQLAPLPTAVLRWVSPAAVEFYDFLLPAEPELLPDGRPAPPAALPAGATVSLYPGATRLALLRLLGLLVLFAAVRQTYASPESLRRLTLVLVANGLLLALFAFGQLLTSDRHHVYWAYPTTGSVFGPFICRNHYPFYLNCCVGAGLGLVLSLLPARRGGPLSLREGLADLLNNSPAVWACVGVALMIASVFFSLSRGGMASLLAAAAVVTVLRWSARPKDFPLAPWLVTALAAFGLLAWFGLGAVENRLESLWAGGALEESRRLVWERTLDLIPRFPVFGSGYGTFTYLEFLPRQPGDAPDLVFEEAHNDYLEALLDGGVIKLGLFALLLVTLFRLGIRAYRRAAGEPGGGLILGALFGLTAVAAHSFGDFGMQMPAIAFLVTVLCAHLAALGGPGRDAGPGAGAGGNGLVPDGRWVPAWAAVTLALAALVTLAAVLAGEGWRLAEAERYRLAAARRADRDGAGGRQRQLEYLTAAVRLLPGDATLHLTLAEAHGAAYREAADPAAARAYLREALAHYLVARDLCPLLERPNVRLAAYAGHLRRGDPPTTYLERAVFLRPVDAELWYLLGRAQLEGGGPEKAWASWARSLELSDAFLGPIQEAATARLGSGGFLTKVLPGQLGLIRSALAHARAEGRPPEDLSLYRQKAVAILGQPGLRLSPADWHWKGQLLAEAGEHRPAADAFRRALAREPRNVPWRVDLANALRRAGDAAAAYTEAREARRLDPANPAIRELLAELRDEPGR